MSDAATPSATPAAPGDADEHLTHALGRIHEALRGLRFGAVTVIVQDGHVIQVERTEKLRLLRRDR